MIRWVQAFVLLLAAVSFVQALRVYRMGREFPLTRWGVGANAVLPLVLIALVAPSVLGPSVSWLQWASNVVSLALIGVVLLMLRRQRVAVRAAADSRRR